MNKEEFIKIVKSDGMETALSMSAREENKNWKCPVCESQVVLGEQKRFESDMEHVTQPNKRNYPLRDTYVCSNKECVVNEERHNVFWSYTGSMYGGFMIDDEEFIDENNAPFGSYERKQNVEIWKSGVEDRKMLSPAWCLWLLQPYLQYHYNADKNGKVLKKWYKIEFFKKNENGDYCIGYIPPWRTYKFLWKQFHLKINSYREREDIEDLKMAFEPSLNRRWV